MDNRKEMIKNIDDVIRYKKAQEIAEKMNTDRIWREGFFYGVASGLVGTFLGIALLQLIKIIK